MEEKTDFIDILLQIGIVLTFIIFAVAVWLLKKDLQKQKKQKPKQGERL